MLAVWNHLFLRQCSDRCCRHGVLVDWVDILLTFLNVRVNEENNDDHNDNDDDDDHKRNINVDASLACYLSGLLVPRGITWYLLSPAFLLLSMRLFGAGSLVFSRRRAVNPVSNRHTYHLGTVHRDLS